MNPEKMKQKGEKSFFLFIHFLKNLSQNYECWADITFLYLLILVSK